jgi:hypothetical protein
VLRLEGEADRSLLERVLGAIVARHEVLRTVIREEEGVGYQEVLGAGNWRLGYEQLAVVEDRLRDFIEKPFDLSREYMLRACLFEIEEGDYVLAIVFHHIARDGWSDDILLREFVELYNSYSRGVAPSLSPLPLQYRDYAIWQRRYISGDYLEAQLGYWEEKLRGAATLELPTDYVRPAVQSAEGSSVAFSFDRELTENLRTLCRREGTTLYMLLLAGFKILLHRYSGQGDIVVGTPIANRTQAELEGMIGFFVNTLVIRSTVVGEAAFRTLLHQVKLSTLEAYDHQQVPFEKVVERVVKERDMSRSPLFQILFSLLNTEDSGAGAEGLEELGLSEYAAETLTTQFDLDVALSETVEGISCRIGYSTALFNRERIERMGDHYRELLKEIVRDIDQRIGDIDILTAVSVFSWKGSTTRL